MDKFLRTLKSRSDMMCKDNARHYVNVRVNEITQYFDGMETSFKTLEKDFLTLKEELLQRCTAAESFTTTAMQEQASFKADLDKINARIGSSEEYMFKRLTQVRAELKKEIANIGVVVDEHAASATEVKDAIHPIEERLGDLEDTIEVDVNP